MNEKIFLFQSTVPNLLWHNLVYGGNAITAVKQDCEFLNVFESLEIYKNNSCLINSDNGPILHLALFSLMLN